MPKPTGPQFDPEKLQEHIDTHLENDVGYHGKPRRGQLPRRGTVLYHGVETPEIGMLPNTTGIHWTTRPTVAAKFAEMSTTPVIAAIVDSPRQVIPRMRLIHSDRSNDALVDTVRDSEQEFHVRPGARLRVVNRDELRGLGLDVPSHINIEHPEEHAVQYTNLESFRMQNP